MQFEIEQNESSSYPHYASPFGNQAVFHKTSVCSLVRGGSARVAFRRGKASEYSEEAELEDEMPDACQKIITKEKMSAHK
jgi:hypothetical protein